MATSNSYQIGTSELRSPEALRATFAEFIATALFLFFGVGSVAAMLLTAPTFGGGIVIRRWYSASRSVCSRRVQGRSRVDTSILP